MRRIRISPWVWPVLAVVATAVAGKVSGPTGGLLTAAGLVLFLGGVVIGVRWVDGQLERTDHPVRAKPLSSPGRHTDLRGRGSPGPKLANADLRRADLRGADLTNADLSGANLENAVLSPLDRDHR